MSEYKIVNATQFDADLTSICDTIRALPQGGQSDVGNLSFPEGIKTAIIAACDNAYQAGQGEGGNTDEAYEQGLYYAAEQAQQFGAKTNYQYWKYYQDITNLKIPYAMQPTNCQYMFANAITQNGNLIDLSQFDIDFSKCTSFNYWLNGHPPINKIGILNTTSASNISTLFFNDMMIQTIEHLILKDDGSQTLGADMFRNAQKLANINQITGKFGQSFRLYQCYALTHDSLVRILEALKDYSGTSTAPILTISGGTVKDTLTDAERAIATNKGWSIA